MLDVGFGAAIITPPTPVQLAGFAEDQRATEVHDDLEVRTLYVRGELGAVCLVVCDLLGMSPSFARPVRESVAAALGLDLGAVLTSCVHTHAGPSTMAGTEVLGWDLVTSRPVERRTGEGIDGTRILVTPDGLAVLYSGSDERSFVPMADRSEA